MAAIEYAIEDIKTQVDTEKKKNATHTVEVLFAGMDTWWDVGETDDEVACRRAFGVESVFLALPLVNGVVGLNRADIKAIRIVTKE